MWPEFGVTVLPIWNLVFQKLKLTILVKDKVLIWYCTQEIIIIWIPLCLSNLIMKVKFHHVPSPSLYTEFWWWISLNFTWNYDRVIFGKKSKILKWILAWLALISNFLETLLKQYSYFHWLLFSYTTRIVSSVAGMFEWGWIYRIMKPNSLSRAWQGSIEPQLSTSKWNTVVLPLCTIIWHKPILNWNVLPVN